MRRQRQATLVVFGLAGVGAAWQLRPHGLPASNPPDAAIVWACRWLGCALGGYLGCSVALAAILGPPEPGSRGSRLAGCTPRMVRRLVHATLSFGLVSAVAAPGTALARSHGSGDPLDWPGLAAGAPVSQSPAAARPPRHRSGVAVVRPGDSLWSISARRLGPAASPAAIAAAWPRWYAANRVVIGPDPDLIHPGQRLRPPADEGRQPR